MAKVLRCTVGMEPSTTRPSGGEEAAEKTVLDSMDTHLTVAALKKLMHLEKTYAQRNRGILSLDMFFWH